MSHTSDEETPLLGDQSQTESERQRTPIPWRQFSILLLLQIFEPLTAHLISPFLPQLIRDIGITDGEDSRVGYYVGLMHSLFYLTEACAVFHWSRLSDKIGRKPVLLVGLFGLSLSMWGVGLSKTFSNLVISRCLNGALNGSSGVIKSMTLEVTDPTNIAQAYAIIPVTWALAMTLGPLIGGSLARPAERFPGMFGDSGFLKEYPYFLPCAVPATIIALAWPVTFLLLKETTKPQMSLRQYLFGRTAKSHGKSDWAPQANGILHDDAEFKDEQLPFCALLTPPVLIAAGSYATLSLVDIAFRALIPVYYAMSIEMGGLNLGPSTIGTILAIFGISGGIMQWTCFAPMHSWLGPKTMYLAIISICIPVIAMFPVINAVARVCGMGYLTWSLLAFQMFMLTFVNFAFGITFMYIGAATPNQASIGATNGIAQILVSIMRAIGPVSVTSAFSLGIEKNIMGGYFSYWVLVGMVALTFWVGCLLPKKLWN